MVDNNFPPQMGQQGIPMAQPQGNPLAKHLRQPKIYIKLPSGGEYWPGKSLEKTENGEYPVYAMTAKDEITFKTPDALLNGQATVDVIQSCIPNIKDAWQTPSIDIDTILIAIRRASYGEKMAMTASVPKTNITKDFELNLQTLFDNYMSKEFVHTFQIDGFKVQIQPLNYKTITEGMIKAFEEQRIFAVIDDNTIQNQEKLKQFQTSFSRLTELNVQTLIKSVVAIQPDGSEEAVVNPVHIKEFIENTDAKVFNQIKDHIESQKKQFEQQPLSVEADDDEIAAGADKTYNVPIVFDQGNFFD
jgi:hypothetical protein|tara:strand:- start:454 stop:1362 length:909 start_codon:yes stop_codon:yes gene_type:complete